MLTTPLIDKSFLKAKKKKTDEYLYAICIVPLQLKFGETIAWQNPRPSSTRFCRPLKLLFEKESITLINREIEAVKIQIENIVPTKIATETATFNVNHKFVLTMIDGKTFSTVSDTSTQTCGICGATPKMMNDMKKLSTLKPKECLYEFGLSTLHAWIRCFECILHISYRLDQKKWQIRSIEDKQAMAERKKNIIDDMKNRMGLLVDIPKPGFGTTNDGNSARRFFQNPGLASSITGIEEQLIKRLGIILRTMASGYTIDVEAFRNYSIETANIYIHFYPWYYMPAGVHRILLHGADIIKSAVLPIGMLSEEAMESRNKDFRNYREL